MGRGASRFGFFGGGIGEDAAAKNEQPRVDPWLQQNST
jgi:hypothetical protein